VDHDFGEKAFDGGGNFISVRRGSVMENPARSMSER
jgi:hypothetical protein